MSEYSLHCFIKIKNGLEMEVVIHFRYELPECHAEWQDKEKGSIFISEIHNALSLTPLSCVSVIQLIKIRHLCWNYIEHHQLVKSHNIVDMYTVPKN